MVCVLFASFVLFSFVTVYDFEVLIHFLATFQFKPNEIKDIMKDFEEPGHLAPTGLHLGGTKYMVIQGEPEVVIRGKKVTCHTKKIIIIVFIYLFLVYQTTILHDAVFCTINIIVFYKSIDSCNNYQH